MTAVAIDAEDIQVIRDLVLEVQEEIDEKDALVLNAVYELGVLNSKIVDHLPGDSDEFVRTELAGSLANAMRYLAKALG